MSLSLPEDREDEVVGFDDEEQGDEGDDLSCDSFLMNAVLDEETGDMVATDVLLPSSVVARFANVAERSGYVTLGFDIRVPEEMADSKWRLKLYPVMVMQDDSVALDAVVITGSKYREEQLRGYERYRKFIASIVTDTTDFVRVKQLELFLMRHLPEIYKMRCDSSVVCESDAATIFGVTHQDALNHYTKHLRKRWNDRRVGRREDVFKKLVKDPIWMEGIRLDTVFTAENGEFVYRYHHTFRPIPGTKKVIVSMNGHLYADGRIVSKVPKPDEMTFYISSLSSLVSETPRYRSVIIERLAFEYAKADLDFRVGSAKVDTTLGNNASELKRIKEYIADVIDKEDYVIDSLLIVASCSPDGTWNYNKSLSIKRSASIMDFTRSCVPEALRDSLKTAHIPENWELLQLLVEKDTVMTFAEKRGILELISRMDDPDRTERILSRYPRYGYLRECLYPKLRTVRFEFYQHRKGMVKDTIHTSELDSIYLSGVVALKNLDYQNAADLLGPYRDYNSALALVSADRNHSALEVLDGMDVSNPKVCYLKAVVLARLGDRKDALKYYELAEGGDPSLRHRANLDPELSFIIN